MITSTESNTNSTENNTNSTSETELSQLALEESDEVSAFKRNTSLTQSQRKKISPRINLQQILNSSDDMTPTISSDPIAHPLSTISLDINNDKMVEINVNDVNSSLSNNLSIDDEHNNRG